MRKQRRKIAAVILIALVGMGGFFVWPAREAQAAAGILEYVNFQGKVVGTDGTNVTGGSYNFLFCIYTTASPATPCTTGANNDAVWRESKSLTVTDGIFQTNLGDTTTLPGSVDFDTDNIYLGINFNSNGQMSPLIRFTAAPYAFNADKLDGNDWASPDAIGTGTAAAGTFTDLITNTGGVSIAAGQSYTGAGAVTLSSATASGLTINSGTTGAIAIGDDASAETITIGTGAAAKTLTLGSTTTTSSTKIQSGSGNIGLEANGTGTGNVQIGDGGTTSATPDVLVLDTGSTAPTGAAATNGAMYYDTTASKFKCYENSAWKDCDTTGGGGVSDGDKGDITVSGTGATWTVDYTGSDGIGATSNYSGMEQGTGGIGLLQGCSDGQILKWTESTGVWACAADATGSGGSTIIEKDANETIISDATMNTDNTLFFTASANTAYFVQVRAAWTSDTTAEFKYGMTIPSGTIRASGRTFDSEAVTGAIGENCNINATSDVCSIAGTVTNNPILEINAIVAVGASGGTVGFQWAQSVSTATNTTVLKNSFLEYRALAGASDLAEIYFTRDGSVGAGDIVSIDTDLDAGVKKSNQSYDKTILGIISTNPAIVIGEAGKEGIPVPVALSGRVPVKVTTENGPIQPGDLLTSSSVPGVGMKATKAGQIVGQAMEAFDGEGIGSVLAFVKTNYYTGSSVADIISENGVSDIFSGDIGKAALVQFISQREQLAQQTDFSEIVTDRVAAGLEIVTPKLTAEMVALDKIEAATGLDINLNLGEGGMFKINNTATGETGISFDGNGNAVFQGTLTADTITANKILGLEIFTDQLSGIDEDVADLSAQLGDLTKATEEANLSDLGILEKKGGLAIAKKTTFKSETIFEKLRFLSAMCFSAEQYPLKKLRFLVKTPPVTRS